jgi:hypothetical protein
VVETQIGQSNPETETTSSTSIDVTQIISKVGEFVDRIREISGDGKPMDVRVDSFNFSVSKASGEYTLSFNSKIAIKPKD